MTVLATVMRTSIGNKQSSWSVIFVTVLVQPPENDFEAAAVRDT
jgi:hypothetical protein